MRMAVDARGNDLIRKLVLVSPGHPGMRAGRLRLWFFNTALGNFVARSMLPLPPVPRSVNSAFGEACAILMRGQSAPSSSARIIASDVRTPWPISDLLIVSVTVPSTSMRTQPFGLNSLGTAAAKMRLELKPMIKDAPLSAVVFKNVRREVIMPSSALPRD